MVRSPGVVSVRAQEPWAPDPAGASDPVHVSVALALTVTVPVGVPEAAVTENPTVTTCPGSEGFGSSAVMLVVVATGPGACTSIGADCVEVNPSAENASVWLPVAPPIERSVNAARPLASVGCVVVPPRLPPPDAMAACTATPAVLTSAPLPSRSCTTGCCANGAPSTAVAEG